MRAGVALLAAASMLVASCSSNETNSAIGSTSESAVTDVRLASGSFTVGNPVLETAPKFHESRTEFAPETPFGIADVTVDDNRAVFTFYGEGVVNYVGRYVNTAVRYESDSSLDVPGTSVLQVDLISSPSAARSEDRSLTAAAGITAEGGIESVVTTDPSDGVTQSFIGTEAERPDFTITTQLDPPTLIVEVAR